MIKKRIKAYWNDEQFIFTPDEASSPYASNAGEFTVSGVDGVRITGSALADVFHLSNASGVVNAGAGADIVDAFNFKGTVDLGNDNDGDIVNAWNSPYLTIINADENDVINYFDDNEPPAPTPHEREPMHGVGGGHGRPIHQPMDEVT